MKKGETICYYRSRGGNKDICISILYHNNTLREQMVERYRPKKTNITDENHKKSL